ncbi:hypothetical protein D3C85_1166600 [compost metagenome]
MRTEWQASAPGYRAWPGRAPRHRRSSPSAPSAAGGFHRSARGTAYVPPPARRSAGRSRPAPAPRPRSGSRRPAAGRTSAGGPVRACRGNGAPADRPGSARRPARCSRRPAARCVRHRTRTAPRLRSGKPVPPPAASAGRRAACRAGPPRPVRRRPWRRPASARVCRAAWSGVPAGRSPAARAKCAAGSGSWSARPAARPGSG